MPKMCGGNCERSAVLNSGMTQPATRNMPSWILQMNDICIPSSKKWRAQHGYTTYWRVEEKKPKACLQNLLWVSVVGPASECTER